MVTVLTCCTEKNVNDVSESWFMSAYYFSYKHFTLVHSHASGSDDTLIEAQRFILWARTLSQNFSRHQILFRLCSHYSFKISCLKFCDRDLALCVNFS